MWWLIAVFVVSFIASYAAYALMPEAPKQFTKPAGLGDVKVPTAEEGREIPVIFGTREQSGPNVVWYGDFGSKSTGGGHEYFLGIHMVLCHSADEISAIRWDDKIAWVGSAVATSPGSQATIQMNAPNLFGGSTLEGGVSGVVDFMFGGSNQGQNAYLKSIPGLGTSVPPYRGVVSAILRKCYVGRSPYIKRAAFRVKRIPASTWNPSQAAIATVSRSQNGVPMVYIAFDLGRDMASTIHTGVTRLSYAKAEIISALNDLFALRFDRPCHVVLVGFGSRTGTFPSYGTSYITTGAWFDATMTQAQLNTLITWVNARTAGSYGSYYPAAFEVLRVMALSPATAFNAYNRIEAHFITAGQPTLDQFTLTSNDPEKIANDAKAIQYFIRTNCGGRLSVRVVNIARDYDPISVEYTDYALQRDTNYSGRLDTTKEGVLRLSGKNARELANTISGDINNTVHFDANPANILYDCLTNADWGMGYLASDIDSVSFTAAANTLYNERFGLSLIWDRQIPIENFIREVSRHIDATLFIDRTSGKFKLKLIRDDFDVANLLTLDESNVVKIDSVSRPAFGDLHNSVSVVYSSAATGKDGSVTVHDPAMVQMQGAPSNVTMNYPGISSTELASKVALRDLKTLSTGRLSCTVFANREAASLDVGEVFRLNWPDLEVNNLIMRVVSIAFGSGTSNQVKVVAVEDTFAFPGAGVVSDVEDTPPIPVLPWIPPPLDVYPWEPPFPVLIRDFGGAVKTTTTQGIDPKLAHFYIAAGAPPVAGEGGASGATGILSVCGENGYTPVTSFGFTPVGTLTRVFGATAIFAYLSKATLDFNRIEVGTLVQMGTEMLRVDSIYQLADNSTEVTVYFTRGVIDTVPKTHPIGTKAYFLGGYTASNFIEYNAGDKVFLKVGAVTDTARADPATSDPVELNLVGRAFLPYVPGNVRIDGIHFPDVITFDPVNPENRISLSWSHRDRLLQGGRYIGFTEVGPATAPEPGTLYRIKVYRNGSLLLNTTSTGTTLSVDVGSIAAGSFATLQVILSAERDGYTSFQVVDHTFKGEKPAADKAFLIAAFSKLNNWFPLWNDDGVLSGYPLMSSADQHWIDGYLLEDIYGVSEVATRIAGTPSAKSGQFAGVAHLILEDKYPSSIMSSASMAFNVWVDQLTGAKTILWNSVSDADGQIAGKASYNMNLGVVLDPIHKVVEVYWHATDLWVPIKTAVACPALIQGTPFMFTLVRDSTKVSVYVNGTLAGSQTYATAAKPGSQSGISIGGLGNGVDKEGKTHPPDAYHPTNQEFGITDPLVRLQEAALFSGTLSADEILALYHSGIGWSYADLANYVSS